jgi:hypothetical protein
MKVKIKTYEQARRILTALKIFCKSKNEGYLVYYPNLSFLTNKEELIKFVDSLDLEMDLINNIK